MSNYHYAKNDTETVGPLSFGELENLATSGSIAADTPVIAEGDSTWSTWGSVKDSRSKTRSFSGSDATAAASAADKFIETAKRMNLGAALYALLMIFFEQWLLPARILRRLIDDLSDWGTRRRLPSTDSDMPVLTLLVVVMRPVVHLLFLFGVLYYGVRSAFFETDKYSVFGSYRGEPAGFKTFVGAVLVAYFGQILVSFVFENLGLVVRAANNLSAIAKNTGSKQ